MRGLALGYARVLLRILWLGGLGFGCLDGVESTLRTGTNGLAFVFTFRHAFHCEHEDHCVFKTLLINLKK